LLTTLQPAGQRGGWKSFLHHIDPGRPRPRRTIALKVPKKLPRVLTTGEVQSILNACDRLRDRFLVALLYDSGMRIGEALGLRHQDIAAAERLVTIVPRDNANGARSKSRESRTVPVSPDLIRLWGDSLHHEYGDVDSDYVFVNLFAEPRGQALSYAAVYDLVLRLRRRTGWTSTRTGAGTRWPPGRCATECRSRWSPSSSDIPRSPPPRPFTATSGIASDGRVFAGRLLRVARQCARTPSSTPILACMTCSMSPLDA
jgi:integrase